MYSSSTSRSIRHQGKSRLPGVFTTGESISNTVTAQIFEKIPEIVSGRARWDREELFDEKKPETKNLVTLLL